MPRSGYPPVGATVTATLRSHHPQPFDNTIASNTCRYCSQLVDPLNQGIFVVVSATCRTRGTGIGVFGVLRNLFSVCRSSRYRCIRDTVFSNAAPASPPPRSQSRRVPSLRRGCSRWRDLSLTGTGGPTC